MFGFERQAVVDRLIERLLAEKDLAIRALREHQERERTAIMQSAEAQCQAMRIAWKSELEAREKRISELEKDRDDYKSRFLSAVDRLLVHVGNVPPVSPAPEPFKVPKEVQRIMESVIPNVDV